MHRRLKQFGRSLACAGMMVVSGAAISVAAPGDGININEWYLHPYLNLSGTYDDNVFLDKDIEEEDFSRVLEYGIGVNHSTKTLSLVGRVWGLQERYDDLDTLDHDDFGDRVDLGGMTPGGTEIKLRQEYSELEDQDYTTSTVEDFQVQRFSLSLSRQLTDKTAAGAGYTYKSRDYEAENLLDWQQHLVDIDADYDVSDKSALYAQVGVGLQDGDGNDGQGTSYNVLFGAKSRRSDKIRAEAALGVIGLDSDDADITELGFAGSLAWRATEKIELDAEAEREIQPASIARNNYHTITTIQAGIGYYVLTQLKLSAIASFRNFDLENPYLFEGTLRHKEEDNWTGILRLDYQAPAEFLKVFIEGRYNEQSATIDQLDYNQSVVSAGLNLTY